jgi:hypothetical protein
MKHTQRGYVGIIVLLAIFFLGIAVYMVKRDQRESAHVPPVVERPAVEVVAPAGNDEIRAAADEFAAVAPDINMVESVCVGGFINDGVAKLQEISDTIVMQRIIDPATGERAATQDEAGISCHSSSEKWVLFTALNSADPENEPLHYCVDSLGHKGSFGLDRDNMECLTPGV